jgi:hypothetical protein
MINGSDIRAAAATCHGFLGPAAGADWTATVPGLDFTVASVVAHAANGLLWYTVDLWGGPEDSAAFDLNVRPDAAGAVLIVSLRSAAHSCAASVDAARGLGLPFAPDPELARRVLARLFPWHDPGDDPWQTLLWANGRIDLPGRPGQTGWTWLSIPLEDWDGRQPPLHA